MELRLRVMGCLAAIGWWVAAGGGEGAQQGGIPVNAPEVRRAVEKGLQYLAKRQLGNGAWRARIMAKGVDQLGKQDEHVATTALAALAFMADGSYPDRGKYADSVSRALEWILSCQTDSGYITANGSRMYEHGFATVFLAEAMGMSKKHHKQIEEALRRSVRLYVQCQSADGGWRYQPAPVSSDLSLTVMGLQSLRAARNRGIEVPRETIQRAYQYVRRCENRTGGFQYQPGNRITYNLTAAGLVSLYSIGMTKDEEAELEKHFRYLQRNYAGSVRGGMMSNHYFYGNFYASQACYQRGGSIWQWYWNRVAGDLLKNQHEDGHWEDDVHPNYATAMACLILQIPREYLPIMQK